MSKLLKPCPLCGCLSVWRPKVLAVVGGWAWPDMADFTYSPCAIAQVPDGPGTRQLPVTAIIVERGEG